MRFLKKRNAQPGKLGVYVSRNGIDLAMDTIPQSPEKASPLICKKCGAEVPPGKLVCDCFRIDADRETKQRALENFISGRGCLYLASASTQPQRRHLLPRSGQCASLCGEQFYKGKPEITAIWWAHFPDLNSIQPHACPHCIEAAK